MITEEFTLTTLYYQLTNLLVSEFLKKRQIYDLDLTDSCRSDFRLLIFQFLSHLAYSTLLNHRMIYFGCKQIKDVFDQSPQFSKELTVIYGSSSSSKWFIEDIIFERVFFFFFVG